MECYKCNAINSEHEVFNFPLCDKCYNLLTQEADQMQTVIKAAIITLGDGLWDTDAEVKDGEWKTLKECYAEVGNAFPFVVKWKYSKDPLERIKMTSIRHTSWIDDAGAEYIGTFRDWKLPSKKSKKYACTCNIKDLMTGGCKCGYLAEQE